MSALAMLSLAAPSSAQQARSPRSSPRHRALRNPGSARAGRAPAAAVPSVPAPAASEATAPLRRRRRQAAETGGVELRELSPWSMFLSADILVKAVMIGLALASLATWTIFIAKMIELSLVQRRLARGARQDRRRKVAGRSAIRARRQGRHPVVAAGCGDARGAVVGGNFQRRRHQGAGGIELCRDRARRGAPDPARHGAAGDRRRDLAIHRTVRHGVGHHEQFYRHLEIADHQSCRGRTGHRRSAARHRVRSCRGDPGRHHLQPLFARDEGLPRTGRPRVGRGGATVVARPRSHPCRNTRAAE